MFASHLQCRKCSSKKNLGNFYSCSQCGGILEVLYDYDKLIKISNVLKCEFLHRELTLWKYRELLPQKSEKYIISLGEGGTPLINSTIAGDQYKMKEAYYKLESCNPSGSFKDRPTAVAISKAVELGAKSIIIASSGNAGASAAAYAAKAGLKCLVCVPEATPPSKVAQAISHGSQVVLVKGSYSNSYHLALQATKEFGFFNLTSTFLNPYTVEGDKTLAYEIWEQMAGNVPDWLIIPIGAGPLLVGACKGFEELKMLGWIDHIPRMVGVQTEECSPITNAFIAGEDKVKEWQKPIKSIASGISDPLIGYPGDGTLTNQIIKKTGGMALKLSEADILKATKELAEIEGIFAEPSAATSLAALKKISDNNLTVKDRVVMVITGHGLKTPQALLDEDFQASIVSSLDELKQVI